MNAKIADGESFGVKIGQSPLHQLHTGQQGGGGEIKCSGSAGEKQYQAEYQLFHGAPLSLIIIEPVLS
ncbi:hypothetical protein D9M68_761720 [compost metagenome]